MLRIDQDAIAVEDHQLEGDLHPRSLAALDGTADIGDVETEHLEQRRTVADLLDDARTALDRLTPDEASSALERGAVLVDTRCQDQRLAAGIIPGSITCRCRSCPDERTRRRTMATTVWPTSMH